MKVENLIKVSGVSPVSAGDKFNPLHSTGFESFYVTDKP